MCFFKYSRYPYLVLLFGILSIFVLSCSKDDTTDIRGIALSADKNLAILSFDTIYLRAIVRNNALEELRGLDIQYFVNENPINDTIYVPTATGTLIFKATFQQITSNIVSVDVKSIEEDVEALILEYDGYRYLTDSEWSVGGSFSYRAKIGNASYPFNSSDIQLQMNGSNFTNTGKLKIDNAGDYAFEARYQNFISNVVDIQVRSDTVYSMVTVPILFHDYGTGMTSNNANNLIQELNEAFNQTSFSTTLVEQGRYNPNAVNCYIQFVLQENDKNGNNLNNVGINKIIDPITDSVIVLTKAEFQDLEIAHNIDPNQVLNLYMTADYDFGFSKLDPDNTGGSGNGRGSAYPPLVNNAPSYPGIIDLADTRIQVDPDTLSHSLLFRTGSVFGEHPDFVVNRVAYYFGLYDTFAFDCRNDGDYCKDTFGPDFTKTADLTDYFISCDGPEFTPSNHMSFLSNKNHFTYDQRKRLRFILNHGLNRPGL